nr:2'-5' RNA ligase family protein [Fodinibius salsisoli]
MIDADHDPRYGITLIARPSEAVTQSITHTLSQLTETAPQQYAYPAGDLHLTVLSIISCYPGFSLGDIQPEQYTNIIRSAVDTIDPFHIHFRGLTASPSSILVQGFPEDDQLNQLRDRLRDQFKASSLQHSIDKRYRLETAHMTILRFKQPLQEEQVFIDRLTKLKDIDFGSCRVDQLSLVANDWYQRQQKVQLIEKFDL